MAERYEALYLKEQRGERMTPEEKRFLYPAYAAVGLARRALPIGVLANGVYMSFLAGMIGYSRRRTGLHDLMCGTRVRVEEIVATIQRAATGPKMERAAIEPFRAAREARTTIQLSWASQTHKPGDSENGVGKAAFRS